MFLFLMMSKRRHNSASSLLANALSLSDTNRAGALNLVMKFSQRHRAVATAECPFMGKARVYLVKWSITTSKCCGPLDSRVFAPPCSTCRKSMWICSKGAPTVWGTRGDLAGGGPWYCLHLPHFETCSLMYSPIWGHHRWSCKRACILVIP